MKKLSFIHLALFVILLAFSFRSLLANSGANLVDWRDYPFVAWIIYGNVGKILSLDLSNIFSTNILFPHANNLLLTENLFAQSVMAVPMGIVTDNPILIFNIVFFATLLLNYYSAYMLWREIFRNENIAFLGALLTAFSPFFHISIHHFQLLTFWPTFISLFFLVRHDRGKSKNGLYFSGVFLAVQFLSSVYLAVFASAAIAIYYLSVSVLENSVFNKLRDLATIFGTFIVLCAPVVYAYISVQSQYAVNREYGEYVTYSAHISDYIFSNQINSIVHDSQLADSWNLFNRNTSGRFPGILLTVLGTIGLFSIKSKKLKIELKMRLDKLSLFFLLLMMVGFVFSFGPRANFNGSYLEIPMPYHFIVKYVPFVDVVRVPARWSFLFYLGLTYFALKGANNMKLRRWLLSVFILLTIVEYVPMGIYTDSMHYLRPKDQVLLNLCRSKDNVVLEVPVTHFDAGKNILEGLSYITTTILATTYNNCTIVNGYGSYDLPSLQHLKDRIYTSTIEIDSESFFDAVKGTGAQILVVNYENMLSESREGTVEILKDLVAKKRLIHIDENVYKIN